jgi:hypothetical protein
LHPAQVGEHPARVSEARTAIGGRAIEGEGAAMKKHRISRRVAGLAAAVTLSIGVASPVGLAQYEEVPDPGLQPAAGVTAAKLKQCIKKAKKKFREDPVKKKRAIKKCKKKFA